MFPLTGAVDGGASVYRVSPLGDQEITRRTGQANRPVSPPGRGPGVMTRGGRPAFEPGVVVAERDLAADHGASAWFSVRPVRDLNFLIAYSRSLPYRLNTISFGIGIRLGLTGNRR